MLPDSSATIRVNVCLIWCKCKIRRARLDYPRPMGWVSRCGGQRETVYSVASESIKIKKTSYVRGLSSIFICALKDQNGLIGLNPGIHAAGEE